MLYSHCYLLTYKNISTINKTDQSVFYFATPEIVLEAKLQALGYQRLLAHTIHQFAYMKYFLLMVEKDKILSQYSLLNCIK